jgi:hypothetical protein
MIWEETWLFMNPFLTLSSSANKNTQGCQSTPPAKAQVSYSTQHHEKVEDEAYVANSCNAKEGGMSEFFRLTKIINYQCELEDSFVLPQLHPMIIPESEWH